MELIRETLATLCFIIATVLLSSLIFAHFHWTGLIVALGCLLLAYIIWPSKKRGQRDNDHPILNILEWLIELPIEFFAWCFRFLTRLFRSKDSGIDLDIDF